MSDYYGKKIQDLRDREQLKKKLLTLLESKRAKEWRRIASGHTSALRDRPKLTVGALKAALQNIPGDTPLRLETIEIQEESGFSSIKEFGAVRIEIRNNGIVVIGDYDYYYFD